jgi:hypothetical protein
VPYDVKRWLTAGQGLIWSGRLLYFAAVRQGDLNPKPVIVGPIGLGRHLTCASVVIVCRSLTTFYGPGCAGCVPVDLVSLSGLTSLKMNWRTPCQAQSIRPGRARVSPLVVPTCQNRPDGGQQCCACCEIANDYGMLAPRLRVAAARGLPRGGLGS